MLAARRAQARGDALAFMRQVGFLDSLRAPHWPQGAVDVLDRATTDGPEQLPWSAPPDLDPRSKPYRRRSVFPLRWLEPTPGAQLGESESFAAVSAGLEDLGLSQSDARTLIQTVLTELVENVAKHGGMGDRPATAPVGAILVGADTYALRQSSMHPHMGGIAERALASGSRVLRLIVADSGAGLTARLAGDAALSWIAANLNRVAPIIQSGEISHRWEWHMALARNLRRCAYRTDIPHAKRALALVAAYHQLIAVVETSSG